MTRYEELAAPMEKNGIAATIESVQKNQDKLYGDNSVFLYHFDLGTLYHYNGDYKKSAAEFENAKQVYEDLYTKSVTNEAASVMTNDNVRPYRARSSAAPQISPCRPCIRKTTRRRTMRAICAT